MIFLKYTLKQLKSWNCVLYLLFIVSMCFVLSCKVNYDLDEIFSYGNSNYQKSHIMQFQDGIIYAPGDKLFMEYVTVQPEHRFDFVNVFRNMARDNHPPLYHILLHLICSFFPERFSLWFAGCINIIFAVLTLHIVRRTASCFINDKYLITIVSIAFAFSGAILSAVSFLRMYIMAMFCVSLLTFFFIKEMKGPNTYTNYNVHDKGFLLKVSVAVLLGALTHYYCLIYTILISTVYAICKLFRNEHRKAVELVYSLLAVGVISCIINPAMPKHIILSGRGKEAFANAANLSDFINRLNVFSEIINKEFFGNYGPILVFVFFVLCIFLCVAHYHEQRNTNTRIWPEVLLNGNIDNVMLCYMLIGIPTVLYFIIISKIAAYRLDRYMFPIYGNIILLTCLLLVSILKYFAVSRLCKVSLITIAVCVITVKSWFTVGWYYLYLDSKPFLENVSKTSPVENICLYKYAWCTCAMFLEVKAYRSITFCNFDNGKVKQEIFRRIENSDSEKLVLTLVQAKPEDHSLYINELLKRSKTLNHSQKLGSFFYDNITTYYLSHK